MFVYRELFIATQDHVQLIHLANIYTKLQQKGEKEAKSQSVQRV